MSVYCPLMFTEKPFDVMAMHCPLMFIDKTLILVYCPLEPIEKPLMSVYCKLLVDVSVLFIDVHRKKP